MHVLMRIVTHPAVRANKLKVSSLAGNRKMSSLISIFVVLRPMLPQKTIYTGHFWLMIIAGINEDKRNSFTFFCLKMIQRFTNIFIPFAYLYILNT